MKKLLSVLIAICLISMIGLCGCSSSKKDDAAKTTTTTTNSNGIDVDLSAMSSTMVYSEVSNIMSTPADYIGKTIKMKGTFNTSESSEIKGTRYYFALISDATACCQQGIEFKVEGNTVYPDDYPAVGTEIELTGVYQSYQELNQTYYYLDVDSIKTL